MTNLIANIEKLIEERRKDVTEAKNAFVNDFNADVEEANKLFEVSQTTNDEVLDIEPHIRLKFNSPDTVAECFPSGEGAIDDDLYKVLWSMTQYYDTSFSEEPDPEKNNTALFWDKFTYEQKVALNNAAFRDAENWG